MKNYTMYVAFFLFFFAGSIIASDRSAGLKGPQAGSTPYVINMRSLPAAQVSVGKSAQEIPLGFELSVPSVDKSAVMALNEDNSSMSASTKHKVTSLVALNGAPAPAPPQSPLKMGTNFNGPVQNGYVPYSAAIAVGPSHVIVMSNSQFAIYSKNGTLLSLTQDNAFFPIDGGIHFKPKCYYDAAAGHFVMLTTQAQSPVSFVNIAVSQTSDPTGAWWMYHLDWTLDGTTSTRNWGDWTTLGYDDNAIYVTANQFSFSNVYQYSKVRILSKAQLFSGMTVMWTDFTNLLNADGSSALSLNAGQMISSSSSEYLLNNNQSGGNTVTMWRIDNASTVPTLTRVATVPVGAYAFPPDARQPGRTSPYIATGDARLQNLIVKDGFLHTCFGMNYGGTKTKQGAGVQYLKISTSGVVSKNLSYYIAGIDYYYPAVTLDASGNLFMVFSRSSPNEYASMYRAGMMTNETAIEAATIVKAGQGLVINGRWGTYNGIANDPVNSSAVWVYSAWEQSNNTWGSWVAATSFATPPINSPAPNISEGIARSFTLNTNYPNPFNPSTVISYTLTEDSHTHLVVYDVLGREVATLVDDIQTAGAHAINFNANGFASGVYYYKLEAGREMQIRKMLLMK